MKGKSVLVDCVLKCGKYRKETYNKQTIKDIIEIINHFLENELEIRTKITYNSVMNMIIDKRPANKMLGNFIQIQKHIPIDI